MPTVKDETEPNSNGVTATSKDYGPAPRVSVDRVEWRVDGKPTQGSGGPRARFVPYIDARDVAALLDQWVGPLNWQARFEETTIGGKPAMWGIVSVRHPYTGEWIEKRDIGVPSNFEAAKGLVSDAFKRAGCVQWGCGRNVYELPSVWAPCKVTGSGDKEKAWPVDATMPAIHAELKRQGVDTTGGRATGADPTADPETGASPRSDEMSPAPARELAWPDDYADDTPLRSTGPAKSTLLGLVGNDKTKAAELWKTITDPGALTLGDLRSLANTDQSTIPSAAGRPAPSSPPPSAAPAPGPTPATKTQRAEVTKALARLDPDKRRQVIQWCEANHHDIKNLAAASYAPVMQAIDNTARVQPSPKPARSGLAPAASVMEDKRKRDQLRAELVGRLELLGQEFIDAALKAIKDAGGSEGTDLAEVVHTTWPDSANGNEWLTQMVEALEEEAGKPYEEPASDLSSVDY